MVAMSRPWLWDDTGIAVSGLCMLHCLALPVVLVLSPGLAAAAGYAEALHPAFGVVLVGVAAAAFVPGYRQHGRRGVLGLGVAGLALVLTGSFAHNLLGGPGETVLTVAGSLALVAAHWANRSACVRHLGAPSALEA
jgi:hypothetical protein